MTLKEKLTKIINSPVLWIETFLSIVNKQGQLVPFKLNPQQKKLLKTMDKYNIVLKSRQIGISSASLAYSLYLAITHQHTTCLLMSYSIDSATGIFEKLKQLYYDLPEVIQVPLIANNKKELKFINGSRIIVTTCGNKDCARGLSIRFCHLSEISFMNENVERQILAIEQALTPNGKMILESTANGLNYFSELWGKSERKSNLYKNYFFNWIDDKIMFADEYEQFTERYINMYGALPTKDELDETEIHLYNKGATIEQLVWRRLKIANSSEDAFHQEYPSNPVECFLSTGNNVFNSKLIHKRLESIDEVHTIAMPNKLPNSLKTWYNRGFSLWKAPKVSEKYYIGVDTSEGLKQDYSVIEVLNKEGFQMAEFRSNKIKPFQFAEIVRDLAIYFNKALLVIEKASAGHTVLDKIKNEYMYNNLYKSKSYDKGVQKRRSGFITNSVTKPIIIGDFVELFETDGLCINSKILLEEMKLYTSSDGKMGAVNGEHDDCVMAFAMSIAGLKQVVHYI